MPSTYKKGITNPEFKTNEVFRRRRSRLTFSPAELGEQQGSSANLVIRVRSHDLYVSATPNPRAKEGRVKTTAPSPLVQHPHTSTVSSLGPIVSTALNATYNSQGLW